MKKEDIILLTKKLDKNKLVHITLETKRFYNGIIMSFEDDDMLSFNDIKLGYLDILYSQIIAIEPYKEKNYEWYRF